MLAVFELAPAVSAVAASAAVVVSIVVFAHQQRLNRRAAAARDRTEVVQATIDAVGRAARAQALYPISALWTQPELEITLLLPRLTAATETSDMPIAIWVARQLQRMQHANKQEEVMRLALGVAFRLGEWNQGRTPRKWFEAQNREDPFVAGAEPPAALRRTKRWRTGLALGATLLGLATLPQLARKLLE